MGKFSDLKIGIQTQTGSSLLSGQNNTCVRPSQTSFPLKGQIEDSQPQLRRNAILRARSPKVIWSGNQLF